MAAFELVVGDPKLETCGKPSRTGRMHCELPPDHRMGEAGVSLVHYGRDRIGRWRTWQPT